MNSFGTTYDVGLSTKCSNTEMGCLSINLKYINKLYPDSLVCNTEHGIILHGKNPIKLLDLCLCFFSFPKRRKSLNDINVKNPQMKTFILSSYIFYMSTLFYSHVELISNKELRCLPTEGIKRKL